MLTYFIINLLCDTLSVECAIAVLVLSVNLQQYSDYLTCHSNVARPSATTTTAKQSHIKRLTKSKDCFKQPTILNLHFNINYT